MLDVGTYRRSRVHSRSRGLCPEPLADRNFRPIVHFDEIRPMP